MKIGSARFNKNMQDSLPHHPHQPPPEYTVVYSVYLVEYSVVYSLGFTRSWEKKQI